MLINSFNLHQVVTEPTRFSASGKGSLLDLILVTDSIESSFVLPCIGNSDHAAVDCVLRFQGNVCAVKRVCWCTSHADIDRASSLINSIDWADIMNSDSIDDVWNAWKAKFLHIMVECVPKKSIVISPSLPWLNVGLVRKMCKRNKYYRRSKRLNSVYYLDKYQSLRNELVSELRSAKLGSLRVYRNLSGRCQNLSVMYPTSWLIAKLFLMMFRRLRFLTCILVSVSILVFPRFQFQMVIRPQETVLTDFSALKMWSLK